MPLPEWYNENANRDYPLVDVPDGLGDVKEVLRVALLDAGFFAGTLADAPVTVQFDTIVFRTPGGNPPRQCEFHFSLRRGATQLGWFKFVYQNGEGRDGEVRYSTAVDVDMAEAPALGLGFLTTGDLSAVWALDTPGTPGEGQINIGLGGLAIEPGLVQVMKYVSSVNLANDPGPVVVPCGSSSIPAEPTDPPSAIVMSDGIIGDVLFKPGYNCTVGISEANNRIEIGTGVGAGEGEPCSDVSREPSSSIPELDRCDELIYTINVVTPDSAGNFSIRGDLGIYVQKSDLPHTVEILVDSSVLLKNCG